MSDVFISYKRRLRPQVEEIAATLRGLGLTVWYDAALEAGRSFSAEISNEVRTAKCVLVCWSDDAFPHGGDKSGWVVGEATIGQSRDALVPVLLEYAELDPPWNTIHTESLIGWSPDRGDQSAWQNVLRAIGRQTGRPELAGEAAASPAPEAATIGPSRAAVAIAALTGAVLSAIGIVLLMGVDPAIDGRLFEVYPWAAGFGLIIAFPFWRAGRIGIGRALLMGLGFAVAVGLAYQLGILAIGPVVTALPGPAYYDLIEAIFCAVGGVLGAALSLSLLPVLGLVPRSLATAGRIAAASLVLGIFGAIVGALPFFDLTRFSATNLWLAPPWQLIFALALVFVLGPPLRRSSG